MICEHPDCEAPYCPANGGGYYVTVIDGDQHGFLLGPYDTHAEALGQVDRGRDLALQADAKAWFYAFGTARVRDDHRPTSVFGV